MFNTRSMIPTITVDAHCDIPCGIYDPVTAKIAARTVSRMIDQMEELETPKNIDGKHEFSAYIHALSRRMRVKEEHAEICKRELEILWSDFFKPEHLEKYPKLHNLFWTTIKLASKCKQAVSKENARALLNGVDEIAKIFYETKGAPSRFEAYKEITDNLY